MSKIQEAFETLREAGYIVKAWCKEDIEIVLEDSHPEIMAGRRDEIANAAMDSHYWSKLSDCTDQDWLLVGMAIDEAFWLSSTTQSV